MKRFNLQKNTHTGFTLVELLLYLALIVVMIGIIGNMGIGILANRARSQALLDVHYNAQFIFGVINFSFHEAEGADIVEVGSSTQLRLDMIDPTKDPTIFELQGGSIWVTEGVNDPVKIGTQETTFSAFDVIRVNHEDSPDAVRIHVGTAEYNGGAGEYGVPAFDFYTTLRLKLLP